MWTTILVLVLRYFVVHHVLFGHIRVHVFAQIDDPEKGLYEYPSWYSTNKDRLGDETGNFITPYYLTLPQADHDKLFFERLSPLIWPKNIVYYDVDPLLTPYMMAVVNEALDIWSSWKDISDCIEFVQRYPMSDDLVEDYMSFTYEKNEDESCYATRGKVGGQQYIKLTSHCFDGLTDANFTFAVRTVIHEMLHTIGLSHEHTRPDRDCYMFVGNRLICSFVDDQDEIITFHLTDPRLYPSGFPYDYSSILHYEIPPGFENNYKPHFSANVGRLDPSLSELDKLKIKFLYCGGKSYCQMPEHHQDCKTRASNEKHDTFCIRKGPVYDSDTYNC